MKEDFRILVPQEYDEGTKIYLFVWLLFSVIFLN